jgi:hypothetical protein
MPQKQWQPIGPGFCLPPGAEQTDQQLLEQILREQDADRAAGDHSGERRGTDLSLEGDCGIVRVPCGGGFRVVRKRIGN